MKFRTKILLVYIFTILVTDFLGTIIFSYYVSKMVEKNYVEHALSGMEQIGKSIEQSIESISTEVGIELINPTFTDVLFKWLNNPTDESYVYALTNIAYSLRQIRQSSPLISSVSLYTPQGSFDELMYPRNADFKFSDSEFVWKEENPSTGWFLPREDTLFNTGRVVMPYVYHFQAEDREHSRCTFIVELEQKKLQELIKQTYHGFDGIVLYDKQRNILLQIGEIDTLLIQNESLDLHTTKYVKNMSQREYVFHYQLGFNDWHILMVCNKDESIGYLNKVRLTLLTINLLIAFLGVLIVSGLVIKLTKSLKDLASKMDKLQSGDLSTRFDYDGEDEIGQIAFSFNYMADRIEELDRCQKKYIEALKKEKLWGVEIQKQKRCAELNALQAQINPHFLYNTLNVITWEAASRGEKKISALSSALGKFFRLSLSKGAEVITLKEEIEHVKNYLSVQQLSRDENLFYEINLPEDLENFPVIKIILQPLVENALYHGIRINNREGSIKISARKEEKYILLEVEDNGRGIAADKLEHINQFLKTGCKDARDGYGIYNVNERIKLYYGYEFGLSYESCEGSFTRAILKLPYKMGE